MNQPTASKTALLLQCPRPFASNESEDLDVSRETPNEPALYGTRFHKGMAIRLSGNVMAIEPEDDALCAHMNRAYEELRAWMLPDGNPWGLTFRVIEVETSKMVRIQKSGITRANTVLVDPDGEHRYVMQEGWIAGTADVVLESIDSKSLNGEMRVVLDHKTGEWGDFTRPASNPQMQTLALMWMADAVAILHTPRHSAPVIYAEEVAGVHAHRVALQNAMRRIDSGFLRVGPECRYCPARGDCPAQQGELIASTNALAVKTLGFGIDRSPLDKGKFHMLLTQLNVLEKMARAELREEVRAGAVIERPDGKVLELVTKTVDRLSKKSIMEAYGQVEGEEVLQRLRDDGALKEVPQEELRAK